MPDEVSFFRLSGRSWLFLTPTVMGIRSAANGGRRCSCATLPCVSTLKLQTRSMNAGNARSTPLFQTIREAPRCLATTSRSRRMASLWRSYIERAHKRLLTRTTGNGCALRSKHLNEIDIAIEEAL